MYKKALFNCIEEIWKRGLLKKGVGLCHGISGNAYSFIITHYYLNQNQNNNNNNNNNNEEFEKENKIKEELINRAYCFAEYSLIGDKNNNKIIKELLNQPDVPLSFFNGLAGAVLFYFDLLLYSSPSSSASPPCFPCYDL